MLVLLCFVSVFRCCLCLVVFELVLFVPLFLFLFCVSLFVCLFVFVCSCIAVCVLFVLAVGFVLFSGFCVCLFLVVFWVVFLCAPVF